MKSSTKKMVSIIVPGLYHYRYYVGYMGKKFNYFFFYSHKINTIYNRVGVVGVNLFLKEYVLFLMVKLLGAKSAFKMIAFPGSFWDFACSLKLKKSDAYLFLLQGLSARTIKKARDFGGVIVGEAVNVHPYDMERMFMKDLHNHGVHSHFTRSIIRKKIKEISMVDWLLVPSDTVKKSYISHGFPPEKILKVPYGFDLDASNFFMKSCEKPSLKNSASLSETKKISIICVGQVMPRKGQFHLLMALGRYCSNIEFNVKLIGLADQNYLKALNNLNFSFEYLGVMPRDDVFRNLAESNVLVLPSLEDGFGMVVAEALVIGLPVVVSKYAGVAELIEQVGGGVVVDPMDGEALVKGIRDAVNGNFKKLERSKMFGWEKYASLVECALEDVLQEG